MYAIFFLPEWKWTKSVMKEGDKKTERNANIKVWQFCKILWRFKMGLQ